jgi:hypothetical protein
MTALIALSFLALATAATAQRYTRDENSSQALTTFLHKHRLPMVGAQVLDGDDGSHRVILYGFVATDQGRYHAETRARNYLGSEEISFDNRIVVDPGVRKNASPPDNFSYNPPPPAALPSTSIFGAPRQMMRYPTPIPTIAPNLFAP